MTTGLGTALITGATAGLGAEFARQLGGRGHDLVLVARDQARLEETAAGLRAAYGIEVEVMSADLSDRGAVQRVADRVADAGRPVDILVNNAGYALKHRFPASSIEAEEQLFDVLCRAVLVLTHAAVTAMQARGRGQIINVSSVAGYIAGSSYSAAKSYVTVLTESVAASLAGSGVTATALCPGFVRTEFHDRAQLKLDHLPGFAWLDARTVVSTGLADADAGRVVSIPGTQYKVAVKLLKVVPRSLTSRPRLAGRPRPRG